MGATPEPRTRWYEIPGHPFYVPQRIPGGPVTVPNTPQPPPATQRVVEFDDDEDDPEALRRVSARPLLSAALDECEAERDALAAERDENERVFIGWRRRCNEAETQRDALAATLATARELVVEISHHWGWDLMLDDVQELLALLSDIPDTEERT